MGENFDSKSNGLLQIQNIIIHRLISTLKLKLTGDEERRVITRFTENSKAYMAYLAGRREWSNYTRPGIEKAIGHFKEAIKLDPNYALAYIGIIDCFLRLATDYLPPADSPSSQNCVIRHQSNPDEPDPKVKLRFEWDWKSAERELRRANDLQTNYPSIHQWYAAYSVAQRFYEAHSIRRRDNQRPGNFHYGLSDIGPKQIASLELTSDEEVQVYCAISREQIDVGNYEAASRILRPWWSFGSWPILEGLNQKWCADLLFTCGELAGCR